MKVLCLVLNILLSFREDFRSHVLSTNCNIINCIKLHLWTQSNIILKLSEKCVPDQVSHGRGLMEA